NAVSQVFFRCYFCYQTLCWSHAPDNLSQWKCPDCILHLDHKVDSVLGRNAFDRYLVKFQDVSFIKTEWIRGTWLAGISPRKKDNFDNKYQRIIKEKSEVVKEEWCNIEICLDVEFMEAKSRAVMCFSGEEELKRSIDQVERVYVKWLERPYVDVCWEKPPSRDQPERYENYKKAYFEWARGCYVELPRQKASKPKGKFEDIEFKEQQAYLVGGKLMDYQMEGMNWLYYQWARNHPAILADEMGLGKTIQIISLLATLYHEHRTWPFLVVAPNSTVPNWKREVEKWAPSMRVVALTGLESTKKLIKNYELLTQPKGLKAHVIITSYQSAMSEIATLKAFPWEVLIVDEGQRLKCDSSNLYRDLMTLKVGQKFLLTGTPLQNNIRELLNLLQFLKPDLNASSLEAKYNSNEPLSAEQITELHVLLKPFFLRRTKADVLTFLPSKSEVIVPVSMVSVQKRLYKSILEKNADLIRAIMSSGTGEKTKHKGSLNNIMIQLRKCLCHPYVYSQEIEEKTSDKDLERRNLIGASGKLELLNILLPKLKEKGHRVLIFSQFLNMLDILEDFLNILDMPFARIDGSTSSDDRQQAIDEYNRPDSTLFVFLLSTRAGGVGINLATADTIIIYDPDFNPHQEKIIRIGNKKLVLDHLIIERLDVDEPESLDIANVLQFGARALFEGNDDTVVKYDDAAIDSLLDRNVLEEVSSHQQPKNANSFAFARIWANENAGELEEQRGEDGNADNEPDLALWDSILKKREEDAQKQRDREEAAFAKGRRKNAKIDYKTYYEDSPQKDKGKQSHNDDDFLVSAAECESESGDNIDLEELFNPHDLAKEIADVPSIRKDIRTSVHDSSTAIYNVAKVSDPSVTKLPGGAKVEISATNMPDAELHLEDIWYAKSFRNKQAVLLKPSKFISNGKRKCIACGKSDHFPGKCPLREILAEQCNICTGFHWTGSRQCPALNHSFIVKRIKNELNDIKEPKEQVLAARKVLAKIYAMFRSKEAVSIKHSKKGQEGIASGISASMD
ncbi:Chromatin remodeling factor mit1, partial [Neolecta irregularis DAH-3]